MRKSERILLAFATVLVFKSAMWSQVSEGFDGASFPPTGWTTSASSGTSLWTRITSSTRNGTPGAAQSGNPATGASKHLTVSLDVSPMVNSVTYYVSVSSLASAGATLVLYAGTDTTSLVILRTINLEDTLVFSANAYVSFTDNIDGTLAAGQTGAANLRSTNPAFIRWSHQKISGTAASCRLEDVSIDNAQVLPVQLNSFTVTASRLNAILRWSTATEVNNFGFEVERRNIPRLGIGGQPSPRDEPRLTKAGGRSEGVWNRVGFVQGAGISASVREYRYVDANLKPGRYAYRIKQVDHDGSFAYYSSAELEIGAMKKVFSLEPNYPNPFNPETTIEFTLAEDGKAVLKVYNTLGQEIATLFEGHAEAGILQQARFHASGLPGGMYVARLESGKQQMIRKMLLVR